jgi:hypothetical protein
MKIAVVVPTRGDRPEFITQCKKLIDRQTLKPDKVFFMDYPPESKAKDITQRIRRGVEKATKAGCDIAVFWEDDDWYHPTYIEWLVSEWKKNKRAAIFGVGETYYYNIAAKGRLHMRHQGRTSTFCTMISLPFKGTWCNDDYPFLDMHLHKTGRVKTVNFNQGIKAIGIKHGVGMCGGGGHYARFKWDMIDSPAENWFKSVMDDQYSFYDAMSKKIPSISPTKNNQLKRSANVQKIVPSQNTRRNAQRVSKQKDSGNNTNTQLRGRRYKVTKVRRK